jgi:hypothetical protein
MIKVLVGSANILVIFVRVYSLNWVMFGDVDSSVIGSAHICMLCVGSFSGNGVV